ncbi:MAG: hypothetical protein A2X81_05960 [Desulfobacterales bacterium GWB2_56_26]|nr:MAG: hypothetical protein A2X81_05960 [Desulfobacterales bacterium GWB2_56_26]
MTTGKRLLLLVVLLLTLVVPGFLRAAGLEVPILTARVTDHADMLAKATEQQLESVLTDLEREESTQLAVVTISTLQGENLEEYSLKVAESWGLGQKGRDNGALLLIVKNDRKLRIEVGYGLEGRLTDLVSGRIIRDVITPRFRNGNFDQGVIDGVGAMIAAVRGEFSGESETGSQQAVSADLGGLLIFFAFAFFILGRILGRHRFAAAILGSVVAPALGFFFLGLSWLILFLIPAGLIAGFLASLIFGSMRFAGGSSFGGYRGGFGGGGFGGGFSGGGGGFGGGGSSGGW